LEFGGVIEEEKIGSQVNENTSTKQGNAERTTFQARLPRDVFEFMTKPPPPRPQEQL